MEVKITIKETTQNFINDLIQIESKAGKDITSDLLFNYLQAIVLARSVDTFTEEDAKIFDEVITVIMVENKYVYDNYVTDAVSELLDTMCAVVNKYSDGTKEV